MLKKQKSRRYKRYIKKQIKKAFDERLFKKLNCKKIMLPEIKLDNKKIIAHSKADWH